MKRRQFLKTTVAGAVLAGAGTSLFRATEPQGVVHAQAMASPSLTPFLDPLPIPRVLRPRIGTGGLLSYYVPMTQFQQQLHRDLPKTTVWGFQGSYPGPTIEARSGRPVRVQWANRLPQRPLLPIDHTLHGADQSLPDVRTAVHLHGAQVAPESDGNPLDWFVPGTARTAYYPNTQPAATLWYHDHAIGITRLGIYAGLSGFYLLRDRIEDHLQLPCGPFDVPLLLQDRTFRPDGQLFYPNQGISPLHPVWVPDFFGDTALANGKVWPFFEVEPRRYRFRLLNGCNSRFWQLALSSGQPFIQIGADGGLLPKPVQQTKLLLAPAERADVIIDFSGQKGATITLTNDSPPPFEGAPPIPALPQIMLFRVTKPLSSRDTSCVPEYVEGLPLYADRPAIKTRHLPLTLEIKNGNLSRFLLDRLPFDAPITERPRLGSTEIWQLINTMNGPHPIHIHLVRFHVLDRQPFDIATYEATEKLVFTGPRVPRAASEAGLKDTVIATPGAVTRVKIHFTGFTGKYVWHCHILEHEDNDMMRPYEVIP